MQKLIARSCNFSLAILALFMIALSTAAQNGDKLSQASLNLHQWGAVTLFHGLPSNHVRAITQDNDGALWFGTDGGLAKYDGRRIQKVNLGLANEKIRALNLDNEGGLIIGAETGAYRYFKGEFKPFAKTIGFAINSIILTSPGQVALASEQGMIFYCSLEQSGSVDTKIIGPGSSPLLSIDPSGSTPLPLTSLAMLKDTLLIGTRGRGILAIKDADVKEIFSRPRAFFISAIALGSDGRAWFGSETSKDDSGLYESGNIYLPKKVETATGSVTAISFDQLGDLWAVTSDQGVFHYRDGREIDHFTFENSGGGLQSDRVYSVFIDREGVVWFGTDRGVCRYDPNSPHAERISDEANSNFVHVLYQSSDGRLWCGTNRGLFIRDGNSPDWKLVEELATRSIHSIAEDDAGHILIGTVNGLYVAPLATDKGGARPAFSHIDRSEGLGAGDSVRSICKFQGAIYLASFGHGLEKLDGNRLTLVWPIDFADANERNVICLHAENDERLWIGTADAGVFSYDGKQVTSDSAVDALRGKPIWSIEGNSRDGMWFGTEIGLFRFLAGKVAPILMDCNAKCVVLSNALNSIWCATANNGLFKITVDEWVGPTFTRLDTEHGLPSDYIFTILPVRSPSNRETLWIGTNRGIAYYQPEQLPPVLRATRILGKRAYQADELTAGLNLEYPQNSLLLDVAAISSRTFPEQFQYSFLLFDHTGKVIQKQPFSHDSQIVMENLKPGSYRVEARGYNNDLIASEPLKFNFTVAHAPFPKATLALSVLLSLSLLALWWGYHQNRKLAGTNIALAKANEQLANTRMQLASETENERRRIARDLHDQTLSDLRRLLMLTHQAPADKADSGSIPDPLVFRHEIESISTEIRRICEDLSPSVLTNVGLTAALEWALTDAVAHLPAKKKFEYEFVCHDDLEDRLHFDAGEQIQLYRIVQEAISNICRHAGAKNVRMAIEISEDKTFLVTLEDNGCGFTSGTKTGRGLSNMRSRASLIEAEVDWQPRPQGGTIFTLKKPNISSFSSA